MDALRWSALGDGVYRAEVDGYAYEICHDTDLDTWTLETGGRTWRALPSLDVAQEVAVVAHEVRDSDRGTTRYRVVTSSGAVRGEEFGAVDDDEALQVLRARLRSGNLPLAPFQLLADGGRVVGSWQRAVELR
ncbi:hypothetical protein [Cellulosimicrobium sp. CUA-896]|uniref:hypothetical protein n=1 Tax=Cellulosimicrobium sp. CUA-896 TaxID=1517881 RepID=UPI00095C7C03|nr:hypothetical protein [Cellulosimicrobium sp. CUA-896]OLT46141.1 hypothetical protein BJF88_04805 [Cellulosimicrobium sp. CUA-896]